MKTHYQKCSVNRSRNIWFSFTVPIVIFLIIILSKMFIIEIFMVKGYSMFPTLSDGESVLVAKCAYGFRKPRNVYEIPLVGLLMALVPPGSIIDKTIKESGMFQRIAPSTPRRGDIVAFNMPANIHYHAVKRVAAISGDSMPNLKIAGVIPPLSRLPTVPCAGDRIGWHTVDSVQRKAMDKSLSE